MTSWPAVLADVAALDPERAAVEHDEVAFQDVRRQAVDVAEAGAGRGVGAVAEVRGELRSRRAAAERAASDAARAADERATELGRVAIDAEHRADRCRHDCNAAELVETPLVEEIDSRRGPPDGGRGRAERAVDRAPAGGRAGRRRGGAGRGAPAGARRGPRPGRRRARWPASTACSARCSTSSSSTTGGRRPSRRRWARRWSPWSSPIRRPRDRRAADAPATRRRAVPSSRWAWARRRSDRHRPAARPVRTHVRADRPGVAALLDRLLAGGRAGRRPGRRDAAGRRPPRRRRRDRRRRPVRASGWRVGATAAAAPRPPPWRRPAPRAESPRPGGAGARRRARGGRAR